MNDSQNISMSHAETDHLHHRHQIAAAAEFSTLLQHQQGLAAAPLVTLQDSTSISTLAAKLHSTSAAAAFDNYSQQLLCNPNPNSVSSANSSSNSTNILHLLSAALNVPATAAPSHDLSIINNFLQAQPSPAAAPHNFFNQLSPCNGATTNFDHFSEMTASANFLDLFSSTAASQLTNSNTNTLTVVPHQQHHHHHGFLQQLQPLEAFPAAAPLSSSSSPTLYQKRAAQRRNNNSSGANSLSGLSIQLPRIPTPVHHKAATYPHGAGSRTGSPVAMASPNSIINPAGAVKTGTNLGSVAMQDKFNVTDEAVHRHHFGSEFNDVGGDDDDCDALFRMGDDELSTPGAVQFNIDTSGDEAQGGSGAAPGSATVSAENNTNAAVTENKGPRGKVKGPPAKNLMAERRRRKKLNDRLYTLRSVVPKISKMDRASILGDAIEYLKELLQRINELHNELEAPPVQPPATPSCSAFNSGQLVQTAPTPATTNTAQLTPFTVKLEDCAISANSYGCTNSLGSVPDPSQPAKIEIRTREGALNIHMLCPRRPGLLLSTMRALDSLGLDVQQAVISCFNGFALDVFRAEKSQEHDVAADEIKRVLLLTASSTHDCN